MHRLVGMPLVAALVALLCLAAPVPSSAEITVDTKHGAVTARARGHRQHEGASTRRANPAEQDRLLSRQRASADVGARRASSNGSKDDAEAWAKAMQAALDRKVAAHERQAKQYQHCLQTWEGAVHINTTGPACAIPEPLDLGDDAVSEWSMVREPSAPRPAGAQQVTLPPQQLAYMAVAQLRLTPPTPGIGPPPSINKWKMAAVGYPLWLWVDGDLDPAPVSQSVLDLTVALDARVQKVDFDMGDGNTVTCQGGGTEWAEWVEPGKKSPDCGYSYQTPSLPKGSYTVTARTHWDVAWSINGQTGTIPLVQVSSTNLPVGELQALVR